MVRPKGVEPLTARFVAEYSIQLSYGRVFCWAYYKDNLWSVNHYLSVNLQQIEMAETEGFEPSIELQTLYSLSRGAPSAARPRLQFLRV